MDTLVGAWQAAAELGSGPERPSVKLALWAGILSARTGLEVNGRQLDLLRKWARKGLPRDPHKVYLRLQGTSNVTHVKVAGLYHAEALERHGKLDGLEVIGATEAEQHAWRHKVRGLMTRHGMGWKCVSFAGLILDPVHCELVPVDRHHLARLGFRCETVPSWKRYSAVERIIRMERDEKRPGVPLGVHAWAEWDAWRMQTGANASGAVQSHRLLSCRVY